MTSDPPRPRLDTIAEQLAQGPGTLADAIRVLGGASVQVGSVTQVSLAPPFARAHLDDARGKVNLDFDLAPGSWLLRDIVADPSAWAEPPRLPSGALLVARRWVVPKKLDVGCTVRVQGNGPLGERAVLGSVHCRIWRY